MQTLELTVPSPAEPARLDKFIVANVPALSRRAVAGLIDAGQVHLDGRRSNRKGTPLRAGQTVTVRWRPSWAESPILTADDVLLEGDGWVAICKPSGLPTHRTDEDGIGVAERLADLGIAGAPVHRLDAGTSGILLVADGAAPELSQRFAERTIRKVYRAVVSPAPADDAGECSVADPPMHATWTVIGRGPGRAELQVVPNEGRTHQIRILMAQAGMPLVGDLLHGAAVPGGAPRLALHCCELSWDDVRISCPPPEGWNELLRPKTAAAATPAKKRRTRRDEPDDEGAELAASGRKRPRRRRPALSVSAATARILRGGHPWVVRDRDTGDLSRFKAGELVDLVDPKGRRSGVAVVDPGQEVCARAVAFGEDEPKTWVEAARDAIHKRGAFPNGSTDAFRVVHGEADGLPGLRVDAWGGMLVATRSGRCVEGLSPAVYGELADAFPGWPLWEQDHFTDLRSGGRVPAGATLRGRWIRSETGMQRVVRELGLQYDVEPQAGLTTGLYTDQRRNRERLMRLAQGRRVANLFGHTGAFSVALASAGAAQAITVDLGRRYIEWTERNLVLNGLDPDVHNAVVADSRTWLRSAKDRFDGMVIDPPAHARGKDGRDWNAERDLSGLIADAMPRLEPRAWMLVCINRKKLKPGWLGAQIDAGVAAGGGRVVRSEAAPPSDDHPRLRGFPEGTGFLGRLVWVEPAS